mmetsp:Transcript_21369/g.40698  ORF Transcript_21369/g.40698 Transcript_21369/m.40698 type:complete len:259 (+) Transcript_21369:134-910(+)
MSSLLQKLCMSKLGKHMKKFIFTSFPTDIYVNLCPKDSVNGTQCHVFDRLPRALVHQRQPLSVFPVRNHYEASTRLADSIRLLHHAAAFVGARDAHAHQRVHGALVYYQVEHLIPVLQVCGVHGLELHGAEFSVTMFLSALVNHHLADVHVGDVFEAVLPELFRKHRVTTADMKNFCLQATVCCWQFLLYRVTNVGVIQSVPVERTIHIKIFIKLVPSSLGRRNACKHCAGARPVSNKRISTRYGIRVKKVAPSSARS